MTAFAFISKPAFRLTRLIQSVRRGSDGLNAIQSVSPSDGPFCCQLALPVNSPSVQPRQYGALGHIF
jgi:hypothetical protein